MIRRIVTRALVVVAATFVATVLVTTQVRALLITHVNVVSVADGRLLQDSTVTISGDTITSVTPDRTPPRDAKVVDGRGRFLIPGLWDMHAHTEATGEPWLQLYVANGVTGIRDMGSALDMILRMRDATATGRVVGPRIFAAGPILDDAPGDWPFRMRVKTAADGRAAVRLLKRRGVDLIKVHDHTPRDAFFAIAEEARRQRLPLSGHIPGGMTAEQVIEAGQLDIEHLSNSELWKPCSGGQEYRAESCRPFFEMLARRGVWSTPTLGATSEILTIGTARSEVSADRIAYVGKRLRALWAANQPAITPDVVRTFRGRAEVGAVVTSDMAKAGVGILTGCDTMIAGFCVHDEMAAMVRGGMTPRGALQAGTLNPARYFGLERAVGSVAAGQRADLVLLDGNPLVDITNVGRIRAVVLAGRLLERADLDQLLAQVRLAAQQ
jgi:imidazolonepropionase-like amidohydrolase